MPPVLLAVLVVVSAGVLESLVSAGVLESLVGAGMLESLNCVYCCPLLLVSTRAWILLLVFF